MRQVRLLLHRWALCEPCGRPISLGRLSIHRRYLVSQSLKMSKREVSTSVRLSTRRTTRLPSRLVTRIWSSPRKPCVEQLCCSQRLIWANLTSRISFKSETTTIVMEEMQRCQRRNNHQRRSRFRLMFLKRKSLRSAPLRMNRRRTQGRRVGRIIIVMRKIDKLLMKNPLSWQQLMLTKMLRLQLHLLLRRRSCNRILLLIVIRLM